MKTLAAEKLETIRKKKPYIPATSGKKSLFFQISLYVCIR
jgi:hypothetical protein